MESNQGGTFERKFGSKGSETRVLKVLEIVVIIVLACMIQWCCHQMIMMENRSMFDCKQDS